MEKLTQAFGEILNESIVLWNDMAVWLIFGFLVAGVLSRLMNSDSITRHLGRESMWSSMKAALFGIPLPLCSCGVVPVGLSLYKRGASKAATVSFLAATPQTGVDSIAVTWAFLGPVFAVIRPIAALLNGLLAGLLTILFNKDKEGRPGRADVPADQTMCSTGDCAAPGPHQKVSLLQHAVAAIRYGLLDFPREIAGMLVFGILLAGVVAWLMPDGFLESHLGSGIMPMIIMAVAGIPMYVCATASVPIAAVLIMKGLSPGAALVFLMTGPATNTASLLLFQKNLGTRTTVLFLISILITAFAAGSLVDVIFNATGMGIPMADAGHMHHEHSDSGMLPGWLMISGSILLAAVCVRAIMLKYLDKFRSWRSSSRPAISSESAEPALSVTVTGMTCQHCVERVRQAISAVEGVTDVKVDLKSSTATVFGQFDRAAVITAVRNAGYEAD
jgi:uncharacterized membrane protein YraQ (UPF0718 family)/copper chaperone CopZ